MNQVNLITNQENFDDFVTGDEGVKIWLSTDSESPDSVFLKLDEIIEPLAKFDVKVGIVSKSISNKFELCVKVLDKVSRYDMSDGIPFIMNIIAASVGKGMKNDIIFHSLIAGIFNINFPFTNDEQFLDINNLISHLKLTKDVFIGRSHLETLNVLISKDNKWKGFLPLNAQETSILAIRNLPHLVTLSTMENVDWVVGNLDIPEMFATGLLFMIKNAKVYAVCLDDLDIIFLINKFESSSETYSDLDLLSPENLSNSFYPRRAEYSKFIINSIEFQEKVIFEINELGLKGFEEEINKNLLNAYKLICTIKSQNETSILELIASLALEENSALIELLSLVGYSKAKRKFHEHVLSEDYKKVLITELEKLLMKNYPLATLINKCLILLNEITDTTETMLDSYLENLEKIIDNIKKNQFCPEKLKSDIELFDDHEPRPRSIHLKQLLKKYVCGQIETDEIFHTNSLYLSLMSDFKMNELDLIKRYIDKICLIGNVMKDTEKNFMKELERNNINQLIVLLSECLPGVKFFIVNKGN
jgi:hypothetical protein